MASRQERLAETLGRDLRLSFAPDGSLDLDLTGGELALTEGLDNLAQALSLRLLTELGELRALGHPSFGSRIRELIGEPLDRPNLELLRRLVRKALLADARVRDVTSVLVRPRADTPGVVEVTAGVLAQTGEPVEVSLLADLG